MSLDCLSIFDIVSFFFKPSITIGKCFSVNVNSCCMVERATKPFFSWRGGKKKIKLFARDFNVTFVKSMQNNPERRKRQAGQNSIGGKLQVPH